MNGIGSISLLASVAAQPFAVSQATSVDVAPVAGDGDGADDGVSALASKAISADFSMSILAKINHASADQALALIQGMATVIGPDGR